jgi:hypothetical protein
MKTPKRYVIPAAQLDEEAPQVRRAAQEVAPYDYRRDAALPYYERFPQFRPRRCHLDFGAVN